MEATTTTFVRFQTTTRMTGLTTTVPTYYGSQPPSAPNQARPNEFDAPHVPVLVHEAEGVRIVLGSHDPLSAECPEVQIERWPHGWMLFLNPVGGSDASGHIFFHDDGRSFARPESGLGPTPAMRWLACDADVPGFQSPPR